MNTTLKIGLYFQALQFSIISIAAIIWAIAKFQITEITILIFMWVCVNIGSLVLIVNGAVKEPERKHEMYPRSH